MEQEPHEKQPARTFKEILQGWRKDEESKLSGPRATTIASASYHAVRMLKVIEMLETIVEKEGLAELVIPRHRENLLHHDISWISPEWLKEGSQRHLVDEFLSKVRRQSVR